MLSALNSEKNWENYSLVNYDQNLCPTKLHPKSRNYTKIDHFLIQLFLLYRKKLSTFYTQDHILLFDVHDKESR